MMRILYECRGITLADTGEGYEVLKDGRTHLTGIGTPREAVVSYCAVLESEMLRRVERYEQKKKGRAVTSSAFSKKRYLIVCKLPLLLYRQTVKKARRHAPLQTW